MNPKRILIIALFDLRHSMLRLKGLVFLIPFLVFWYMVLLFLYQNGGEGTLTSAESILFFSWLLEPAIAQKLLLLYPASLSVFFVILLASTPFFAILSGIDQLASDAGHQTFRFLLVRCSRLEIFLGRFISSVSLYSIALIAVFIFAIWISFGVDDYSVIQIFEYALQILLLAMLYALPFIAFTAIISSFMSSGLGTLLMCFCIYIILLVLGSYLSAMLGIELSLLPSGIKQLLYGMKETDITWAVTGLLTYSLVYLSLAWLLLGKRSV